MEPDLFAGNRVSDFEASRAWYEKLLGSEPAFLPHDTEAVWELAEHRYLYIVEDKARAGGAVCNLFVEDFDERIDAIASRGIDPDDRETYPGKARKVIYLDPDGNEISFGGTDDS